MEGKVLLPSYRYEDFRWIINKRHLLRCLIVVMVMVVVLESESGR
jgi:hypothetical protein